MFIYFIFNTTYSFTVLRYLLHINFLNQWVEHHNFKNSYYKDIKQYNNFIIIYLRVSGILYIKFINLPILFLKIFRIQICH